MTVAEKKHRVIEPDSLIGKRIPKMDAPDKASGRTRYIHDINLPGQLHGKILRTGKARLILIRGDQGVDGLSYVLQGSEHIAGREEDQIIFPDDTWLSPRHANFLYEGERLIARDERSTNGIFLRITQPVEIAPGDTFLCGDQVFRLDATPPDADALRALDEEVAGLPEHLRAAVVLCELDGESRRDAAARLGVPEGTLSSRLAKGRKLLADRLRKRGVTALLMPSTRIVASRIRGRR